MMRKSSLFILLCYFLSAFLYGQEPHLNIVNVSLQIDFIKKDTLPVKITPLTSKINTHFSEYNGILFPDSLFFFSSLRNESGEDYENLFESYWSTKIYTSRLTVSGYSKPVPLPPAINNRKYFNCNFTFNKDRSKIFFARSPLSNFTNLRCEIWESEKVHGKWQKARPLNRRINLPGCNTTQPFFVEYENFSVLYFSTDRPKGFGGMDIWYSVYKDGRFGDPVNLGSVINTPGDEVTPFYDMTERILYFSSNQHPGIGGYDIFYAAGEMNVWKKPANMGVPFNSERNDFYFTVNSNAKSGYFSSNRPSAKSLPEDTCCHDIFHYEWMGFKKPATEDSLVVDTIPVIEKMKLILPLTLFFQNDEPDPKSMSYDTKQNYRNTLSDYIALKDVYKSEYSKGLKEDGKKAAEESIERFFKDSVENGFLKLELFTSYLLQELQSGRSVTIKVSGFASPLHNADYNLRLSSRRIASLRNYLAEYDDGVFIPYLNPKDGNKLIIISLPYGSSQAVSKHVSDNINDKRNSVYSIAASLERRIQIVEVE